MKYIDAWHLIAPTISNKLLETTEGTKAYVMLYHALQLADGNTSNKNNENKTCEFCFYADKEPNELPCKVCSCAYVNKFERK